MALEDLEVFIQERARFYDENLDVSSGSPFDVQVVQPILRRLGADPFSVDFLVFAQSRLNQEFPDLATRDGDAVTDLLIKPAAVLLDPILREIQRIKNNMSFRDPTTLTTEEAEALGANLFSERERGSFSKVNARIYFAQPQSISVNSTNFLTTRSGLHFYPTESQAIRVEEMLLNTEGALYYFDINAIAEKAGEEYNIGPDELVTIANVAAAVRVTNKRRARFGLPEETAVQFIQRTEQELSERSLVTLRGILSKVSKNFSEVTQISVVGFNDPEMKRDVITGGGLGEIVASGSQAQSVADGGDIDHTRRITVALDGTDLSALIGSAGEVSDGWVFTLVDGFSAPPMIRDLTINRVINSTTIEVEERVVSPTFASPKYWMLRKKELTLSGIPGGILFPDSPNGTVTIPDNEIHVGGATDVHVRGADFDTASVVITSMVDDSPVLSGVDLTIVDASGNVSLGDYILDTDYSSGDDVYEALENARLKNHSLAILEDVGGTAGTYRIISVTQTTGASPVLLLDPAPPLVAGSLRWRLFDEIDIDLTSPRETRISGTDLRSIQNTDYVEPDSSIDYDQLGVSPGDTLRIYNGAVAGDYIIQEVLAPFYSRLRLDRVLTASVSSLRYDIFRPNEDGGVVLPLVRVTSVDLLDTSGQPVGSTIPYAKAIDARSSTFSNFANGVRVDTRDVRLGITGIELTGAEASVSGMTLDLFWLGGGSASVVFSGANPLSLSDIASQINTTVGRTVAYAVDGNRLGITPIDGFTFAIGTSLATLFGITDASDFITSRDLRSDSIDWRTEVSPPIAETVDVVQVLDGFQIGFYKSPDLDPDPMNFPAYSGVFVDHDFHPEARRHVQIGFRSVGKARLYFLDPTSAEFGPDTVFTAELETGTVRYFPDPTLRAQKIPALPSGTSPKDGETTAFGSVFTSLSVDFIKKTIKPGDILEVTTVPLRGTVSLADPVASLALKTLVISVDGGMDKTVTFIRDSNSIPSTDVTRSGIATQINRAAGKTICSIVAVGGLYFLEFETESFVIIRDSGTANALLGFSSVIDQNNESPNKGEYEIEAVTASTLAVDGSFPETETRQMYKVHRPETQRVSSTQMAENLAETGLYYVDVELVSEGTGNQWNIDSGILLKVEGYESDGYYLTTDDENLSFSPVEVPRIVFSRSILEVGVSDDPENATQLSGQNVQINYERSSLVASVNNFLTSESERVVNESPLARHLIPYFVRTDVTYVGGSKESEVIPDVETYIKELLPDESFDVSGLEKIILERGATYIENPINLLAVVHNPDRTVSLERSQNRLNTGRLAAFIPDVLNITRRTS